MPVQTPITFQADTVAKFNLDDHDSSVRSPLVWFLFIPMTGTFADEIALLNGMSDAIMKRGFLADHSIVRIFKGGIWFRFRATSNIKPDWAFVDDVVSDIHARIGALQEEQGKKGHGTAS